ncbi:MAG: ribonuclease P protein component [Vicinamibacterales bacterium]
MTPETASKGRLRRRGEFSGVFERGAKRHGRFMSVFVLPVGLQQARLGIAASRKLGGAVERNLAKRRLREVFRLAPIEAAADIVVVPRTGVLTAPFDRVQDEFRGLVDHALRRARTSPAVGSQPRTPRGDSRL